MMNEKRTVVETLKQLVGGLAIAAVVIFILCSLPMMFGGDAGGAEGVAAQLVCLRGGVQVVAGLLALLVIRAYAAR